MVCVLDLFDLDHTIIGNYLKSITFPWEALPRLGSWIKALGEELPQSEYARKGPQIWVHRTAAVAESAVLTGPCIIGPQTEIRHCAFLRGSVLVGAQCVVGNSVELKNAVLFDRVQVPHFNYVGDSILGYAAHLGAGAITSNVKSDRSPVSLRAGSKRWETGLRKCGAMLGDHAEIGCNSVLNPGTVIGRNTTVYPLSSVRGVLPANSIYKADGRLIAKE